MYIICVCISTWLKPVYLSSKLPKNPSSRKALQRVVNIIHFTLWIIIKLNITEHILLLEFSPWSHGKEKRSSSRDCWSKHHLHGRGFGGLLRTLLPLWEWRQGVQINLRFLHTREAILAKIKEIVQHKYLWKWICVLGLQRKLNPWGSWRREPLKRGAVTCSCWAQCCLKYSVRALSPPWDSKAKRRIWSILNTYAFRKPENA